MMTTTYQTNVMNSLGIDESPTLRGTVSTLWNNGYETVFSCAGHDRVAEEGELGQPQGAHIRDLPYVACIAGTGNGSWEGGEGARRGWDVSERGIFMPGHFRDGQYNAIERKYGSEVPLTIYRQDMPL